MKRTITAVFISFAIVFTTFGAAHAHRNDILGELLIGAGSGAIIGHVIARDAEGALVGSMIGGTLGLMVGMEQEHRLSGRHQHGPQVEISYGNRWERHNRWDNRKHRKHRQQRHWRRHRNARW